jgi:hypothetical protein
VAGTKREFAPVVDIHIGVITSSLGGHGSDACPSSETWSCAGGPTNLSNDDLGHLVTRVDPCTGGTISTYQGTGFLDWDPTGALTPPGESSVGALTIDATTGQTLTGTPGLVTSLKALVLGAGQVGCGYEAPLESFYRFLVDPEPYQSISIVDGEATPAGTDGVLLQQRKDFLRQDSVLAIVVLSDENDCSIRDEGQFYLAAQQRMPGNGAQNFHLPKARKECAVNPNDPCCASTGQPAPAGCPPEAPAQLDDHSDDVSLRCWDQKRRFGVDFLYPVDRYVTGLSSAQVPDRQGNLVPNPIFAAAAGTPARGPADVILGAIVGVPWQDLANDPSDLTKGLLSATGMSAPDAKGSSRWDYIIGDPTNHVPPLDPHMIESPAPRSGTNPITGDTLAPPSKTEGGPDAISGHEYTPGTDNGVQTAPNQLEYACVFPLWVPRDCSDPTQVSCFCDDPLNDSPLCADNGTKGRTLQTHGKAYPGIRQLSLVKALGEQGVVGSACPAQLSAMAQTDFGYRPVIASLVDRLAGRLAKP